MFDKEEFSRLLVKARGDRNNKQYADDCGVSRSYVSGYINKSINNAPTPIIIQKLASKADGGVSYEELMKAAGYIDIKTFPEDAKDIKWAPKDDKDVERILNNTIKFLENQEGLMFNGEPVDDTDMELLINSIRNGIIMAKIANKKKYNPHKKHTD